MNYCKAGNLVPIVPRNDILLSKVRKQCYCIFLSQRVPHFDLIFRTVCLIHNYDLLSAHDKYDTACQKHKLIYDTG